MNCTKLHPGYLTRCQLADGHLTQCQFPRMTPAAVKEAEDRRVRMLEKLDGMPGTNIDLKDAVRAKIGGPR